MIHAARLPFDAALPLVARQDFELHGSQVKAGARVVIADRFQAVALWQALKVDCAPADPVVAVEPAPAPVATPPRVPQGPRRRGA